MNTHQGNDAVQAIAASTNRFAFDLYHRLRAVPGTGNLIYSPFSIAAALTMTCAGARGQTERQMAGALHIDLPPDELHPAMGALLADYLAEQPTIPALDPKVAESIFGARARKWSSVMVPPQMSIANALWGQGGYPFRAGYLDLLAETYGTGLRQLDFAAAPEPARQAINDWVSDETGGRIPDLLPPGTVDAATRLLLTNTITFKGGWNFPFEEEHTRDGSFTRLDGTTVPVPMMVQKTVFSYAVGGTAASGSFQVVELGYHSSRISMLFLVPEAGHFVAFEESLDADLFRSVLGQLDIIEVILTLPRFGTTSDFSLSTMLAALGMPDAFDPARADFSGMAEKSDDPLFIAEVVHRAFIAVDEAGTEAGAASGALIAFGVFIEGPVELTIDRPFIYAIYDRETGTILFLGRVLDPSA